MGREKQGPPFHRNSLKQPNATKIIKITIEKKHQNNVSFCTKLAVTIPVSLMYHCRQQ